MKGKRAQNLNLLITLFSLAALLLAGFGYYYLYTEKKETYLHERHFRVLDQIGENMDGLSQTYGQNVKANSVANIKDVEQLVLSTVNDEIDRLNRQRRKEQAELKKRQEQELKKREREFFDNDDYKQQVLLQSVLLEKDKSIEKPLVLDSLFTASATVSVNKSNYFEIRQSGRKTRRLSFEQFSQKYSQRTRLDYRISPKSNLKDRKYLDYVQLMRPAADLDWEIRYTSLVPTSSDSSSGYEIQLSRKMDHFMESIIRGDVFEDFVIIQMDSAGNNAQDIVYETFGNYLIPNSLRDSLNELLKLQVQSGEAAKLDNLPYQVYLQPIQFNHERLIICGLVSHESFDKQKRRVSTLLILVLLLFILLIILLIPILKLRLISDKERLKISDLIFTTSSALFGSSMIVLLLFNLYSFNGPGMADRKAKLVGLNKEISETFYQELNDVYQQLNYYDTLSLENEAYIPQLLDKKGANTRYYPWIYPYFSSIFWADLSDSLAQEWTVRKERTPKVNLAGRSYLEEIKKNRGWSLPGFGNDAGKDFRLEGLLTRTTGENVAVISKPSKRLIGESGKEELASIIFSSSYLYSVIQPILPHGFGFTIIDEAGKVWFHSDQKRNLQENFLAETDANSLNTAMYNRTALFTDGTYLGEDHTFYISPLENLPLHLITFRKKIYDRSIYEQIISLSFILTLAAFFMGLLFVAILIILNPASQILKQDRFVFDWLRPFGINRTRYQFLALCNILIIALGMIFTRKAHTPIALSVIVLSYMYTFLMAFFLLNRNTRNEFLWETHRRIAYTAFFTLVLFNIVIKQLLVKEDMLEVILFQSIPGLIVIVIIGRLFNRYLKNKEKRPRVNLLNRVFSQKEGDDKEENLWMTIINWFRLGPIHIERGVMVLTRRIERSGFFLDTSQSFKLFLLSWLGVLAIFPVIKFYEVAYNREAKLQVQQAQVEFAKDILERNTQIDERYLNVAISDSLLSELKQKGIYARSYFDSRFEPRKSAGLVFEAKYPVWETEASLKLNGSEGQSLIGDNQDDFLLRIEIDACSCRIDAVVPINTPMPGLGHPDIHKGRSSSRLDFRVYSKERDSLKMSLQLQHIQVLNRDDLSLIDSLVKDHQDSVGIRVLVNEVEVMRTYLKDPKIETLSRTQEMDNARVDSSYDQLDSLISIFRPRYNELVRRSNHLNLRGSSDAAWSWDLQVEHKQTMSKNGRGTGRQDRLVFSHKEGIQINSHLPHYRFPKIWQVSDSAGAAFWAAFVLLILGIYGLISFAVSRFFAQNTLRLPEPDSVAARKALRSTTESIFLLVPPRAVETDYLEILLDKAQLLAPDKNIRLEDILFDMEKAEQREALKNLASQKEALPPLVIIENFETMAVQLDIFKEIRDMLEMLTLLSIQTFIISTREPLELQDQVIAVSLGKNEEELKAEESGEGLLTSRNQSILNHQQKWSLVLSHFNQLYFPLEKWKIFNHPREARKFIKGKHSFLLLSELSYQQRELSISGVSVKRHEGLASMEEASDYKSFHVIRLDDSINSPEAYTEKLEKMEAWVHSNTVAQITIISSRNPQEILKIYQEAETVDHEAIRRWNRVFDTFYKAILSINPQELRMKDRIAEIIRRECAHGAFLQGIQQELISQLYTPGSGLDSRLLEEELIIQIGLRAHLFYHSLWTACSDEERLLIYDLAQDGLINAQNLKAVESLVRKGLFVNSEDHIRLMNRSFQNFVLTVVKPEQSLAMEKQIRDTATWDRAKLPLGIIIFSLAGFLVYTNIDDVINETAAIITAVTAFLPVLTKVVTGVAGVNLSFQKIIPNFRSKGGDGGA